jgi:hypothetical protein
MKVKLMHLIFYTTDQVAKTLVSFTLGVVQMKFRSDAVSIENELKPLMQQLSIAKSQVKRVSTDGGGNVKKAAAEMFGSASHSSCVCHLLNLLVEDIFKSSPIVTALLTDLKSIVTFFKMSPVAMNLLKNNQLKTSLKCLVLIQAVPTRWNSQLRCIARYLQLHAVVSQVLNDPVMCKNSKNSPPKPVCADVIPILQEIVKLLSPIDDLTKEFSANKVATSSTVLLRISDVHKTLVEMEMTVNATRDFQQTLSSKLGLLMERLEADVSLSCAQLIDPR